MDYVRTNGKGGGVMNWSDTLKERAVIEQCRKSHYDEMIEEEIDIEDEDEFGWDWFMRKLEENNKEGN